MKSKDAQVKKYDHQRFAIDRYNYEVV